MLREAKVEGRRREKEEGRGTQRESVRREQEEGSTANCHWKVNVFQIYQGKCCRSHP